MWRNAARIRRSGAEAEDALQIGHTRARSESCFSDNSGPFLPFLPFLPSLAGAVKNQTQAIDRPNIPRTPTPRKQFLARVAMVFYICSRGFAVEGDAGLSGSAIRHREDPRVPGSFAMTTFKGRARLGEAVQVARNSPEENGAGRA